MMQQTSLLAFRQLDPQKLAGRHKQVYEAIERLQPCSDKEIASYTGIAYHTVAARRGELGHLVESAGIAKQDGKSVRLHRLYIPSFPALREFRTLRVEKVDER